MILAIRSAERVKKNGYLTITWPNALKSAMNGHFWLSGNGSNGISAMSVISTKIHVILTSSFSQKESEIALTACKNVYSKEPLNGTSGQ